MVDKALKVRSRSPIAKKFRPTISGMHYIDPPSFANYTKDLLFDAGHPKCTKEATDDPKVKITMDDLD